MLVEELVYLYVADKLEISGTTLLERVLKHNLAKKMNVKKSVIEDSVTDIRQAHAELLNWVDQFVEIFKNNLDDDNLIGLDSQDIGDYNEQWKEMVLTNHLVTADLHEAAIVNVLKFIAEIILSLWCLCEKFFVYYLYV